MGKHYRTRDHASAFTSAKHGYLTKRVDIKVFVPGRPVIHHVCKAKPSQWITAEGIEAILDQEAGQLEALETSLNLGFRLVELAPNRFNFVGESLTPTADSLAKLDEVLQEANA